MRKLFPVLLAVLLLGLTWAAAGEVESGLPVPQPVVQTTPDPGQLMAAKPSKKATPKPTKKPTAKPATRTTATPFPTVYNRKGVNTFVNALKNHKAYNLFSYPKTAELAEIWFPLVVDADCTLIKCGG